MTCLSAHMYRQISKCTDKNPKKHYWGGSCPPCPPSGYANGSSSSSSSSSRLRNMSCMWYLSVFLVRLSIWIKIDGWLMKSTTKFLHQIRAVVELRYIVITGVIIRNPSLYSHTLGCLENQLHPISSSREIENDRFSSMSGLPSKPRRHVNRSKMK